METKPTKSFKYFTAIAVLITVFVAWLYIPRVVNYVHAYQEEKAVQKQITDINSQISDLQNERAIQDAIKLDKESQIASLSGEIADIVAKQNELNKEADSLRNQLADLTGEKKTHGSADTSECFEYVGNEYTDCLSEKIENYYTLSGL